MADLHLKLSDVQIVVMDGNDQMDWSDSDDKG